MKVFSFCLYGSNPKYTLGMIENIKMINEYFNEWYTYIYYNNIPADILEKVKTYNNVILINSTYNNLIEYSIKKNIFSNIDYQIIFQLTYFILIIGLKTLPFLKSFMA